MNYQVLARKWRPKKFLDVVGQQHIIKAIIHSFNLNKIHHAYILSGTRGSGKTSIARLFAKGLNCELQVTSDLCGQCKNCIDIESGSFIDFIEIDAASRTKVEDTREFLDNIQYSPSLSRFKIYLIDEVHMLSKHSFNALLKTLEEPPSHVKFILVTTEYQKIPKTIISRCLQFYLKPLTITQITDQLHYICSKENIKIDRDLLELLARAAKGSMRDALNLLEQAIILGKDSITFDIISDMIGILHIEHSISLIENLINGNINKIMNQINEYSILGINWEHFFDEILTIFQKIAIKQFMYSPLQNTFNNNNEIKYIEKRIHDLSNRITPENVQLYYEIFLLGKRECPYAPSHHIGMEMTILRAIAFCPVNIKSKINEKYISKASKNNIDSDKDPVNEKTVIDLNQVEANDTSINNTQFKNDHFYENKISENKLNKIDDLDILHTNLPKISIDSNHQSKFNIHSSSDDNKLCNQSAFNTTTEVLEARLKLINHQKLYNQSIKDKTQSDIQIISETMLKNILQRFSSINMTDILKDNSNDIKKKS